MKGKQALLWSLILTAGMHGNFPSASSSSEHSLFTNFPIPPNSMWKPTMTQPILQLIKSRHHQAKIRPGSDTREPDCGVFTLDHSIMSETIWLQLHKWKLPPVAPLPQTTLNPTSPVHHRDHAFGKSSPETKYEMVYFKQVLCKLHSAVQMWIRMSTEVYMVPEKVIFFKSSQVLQDISSWTNTLFALLAGDHTLHLWGVAHKVHLNAWNTTPLLPSSGNIKFPN